MNNIIRTWNRNSWRTWKICVLSSSHNWCSVSSSDNVVHECYQNLKHYINYHEQHYQELSWTTLSELETLHQLCELERTQILQSLALAILKILFPLTQEQPKTKTVHTYHKTKTVHAYKNYPSWTTLSELETLHHYHEQHYQEHSWTTLSELETLHQLCELKRTQILQSLALAVLKIPNTPY